MHGSESSLTRAREVRGFHVRYPRSFGQKDVISYLTPKQINAHPTTSLYGLQVSLFCCRKMCGCKVYEANCYSEHPGGWAHLICHTDNLPDVHDMRIKKKSNATGNRRSSRSSIFTGATYWHYINSYVDHSPSWRAYIQHLDGSTHIVQKFRNES